MTRKTIEWCPTEEQYDILSDERKFQVYLGGIGCGKTVLGCMWAITQAIEQPGSIGVIVAPTYTLVRDVIWPEFDEWLPKKAISNFSKSDKVLDFKNGSKILFRTADSDRTIERLRGLTVAWFWVDEITLVPELVWKILTGRIRQPKKIHGGLITGTPKMGWVYDKFIKAPDNETMHIIKEIPTMANVYLPPDYIETLKREYTGLFYEQEVLGKFVAFEGLVYDLREELIVTPPMKFDRVLYGVDFGFTNPAAIIVIGVLGDRYFIVQEFYRRGTTDDKLIAVLHSYMDYWGRGIVYCDPSSPASIKKMKDEKINARPADNNIDSGIRNMRSLMDNDKLFVNPACINFIAECRGYIWDDKLTKERPVPVDDHTQDATRYALLGDRKRKISSYAVVR